MITTYREAQKWLESLIVYPDVRKGNLRLERIEHLLKLIDNPHHAFKTVHVSGTSGKGSTAYLIAKILTTAGYKTGLHISPHLQKINERMRVDLQSISDANFVELTQWIKPFVNKVGKTNPFGLPSYFEVLVALSFEYFKRQKVDLAIVEVGLGGTLDATNVITPLLAIITNVTLDHTELLGNTVEKIAQDKAGIIKANIDVVTGAKQPNVIKIITKKCQEKNAAYTLIGQDVTHKIKSSTLTGSLFDLQTPNHLYKNLTLSLLGRHQVENAACAIAGVELLKKAGFIVEEKQTRKALSKALFPGRLEIIRQRPMVILDGAHNPAKMQALRQTLKELFPQKKIIFLLGFKKKKDITTMIKELLPITKKFIVTKFATLIDVGQNMSVEPKQIQRMIRKIDNYIICEIFPDSYSAFTHLVKTANKKDIVCITGSLYLIGEIRGQWR